MVKYTVINNDRCLTCTWRWERVSQFAGVKEKEIGCAYPMDGCDYSNEEEAKV